MSSDTRRRTGTELRAASENGQHFITLRAITPNVVDDYGSVWMADTFDEACQERQPTLAWGHSWVEPIGRGVDYTPSTDGPTIRFRLDDFTAVPMALRAFSQVQSGTIDDCSVGFSNTQRRDPTDAEKAKWPGVTEIIEKADLDEVSLVLRGAVPGAKVLQLRTKGETVDSEFVIDLALRIDRGEITREQAQTAIDLAAVGDPVGDPGSDPDPAVGAADNADAVAAADAALDALERSRR